MEFREVIEKRRTSREWADKEVDFEAIKRMIAAGMKAPSWDHYRNWQFIVLHEREEKEQAFAYAKAVRQHGQTDAQKVLPNAACREQKQYKPPEIGKIPFYRSTSIKNG